jgi:Cu(I)/Ag(I) efflux system membrane protein CusA/SilA
MSSLTTGPISIGREAASSSTCKGSAVGCLKVPIRQSVRTQQASVGSSSTRSSTTPDSARSPNSEACRTWFLRYALASVDGVAEIASIGGFVKQYQVNLDPVRLATYDMSVKDVVDAIRMSNNDVEGRLLEFSGREYMVRGRGYLKSLADIEKISLGVDRRGTPVRVADVADVRIGPDLRRGVAELDGRGEVVGGIVVMRFGENALAVIERVKAKLVTVQPSLPSGVRIVPVYDRSTLIHESIGTLRRTLIEEAIVVSIVIMVFLFHVRSALVPILALPVAVAAAFVPMYYLHVTSNIMSLGGLALAIGVLVDAAIVMVENAYRHLSDPGRPVAYADQPQAIIAAARQVARPIFFSLAIIIISFVPVFLLEAQEGRMFRPLAFTKTSAMVFASLLSITLVPVLMTLFIRGHALKPEHANPVSRFFMWVYEPVLRWAIRWRWAVLVVNLAIVALTVPLVLALGSEFMPPLYEGSILYMPTAQPGLGVTEATRLLQVQDKLLRQVPEIERVFGTVGTQYDTDRQLADGDGEHDHNPEASRRVAARADPRSPAGRHGRTAPVCGRPERVDAADPQPAGHAVDWHQDASGHQSARP